MENGKRKTKKIAVITSGRRWFGLFPPKYSYRHPDGRYIVADDEKTFKALLKQDERFYAPVDGEGRERVVISLSRHRAELLMTADRELTKREMIAVIKELKGQLLPSPDGQEAETAARRGRMAPKPMGTATIDARYRKFDGRTTAAHRGWMASMSGWKPTEREAEALDLASEDRD